MGTPVLDAWNCCFPAPWSLTLGDRTWRKELMGKQKLLLGVEVGRREGQVEMGRDRWGAGRESIGE